MSKKIAVGLVVAVLAFGASFSTVGAQAVSGLTFAQLIDILISTGLIPQEKAASAHAMVNLQAQSVTANATSVQAPVTAAATITTFHSADTNKDWKISDSELDRVIYLYNYRYVTTSGGVTGNVRTGEYSVSTSVTDIDGYKIGPGTQTGRTHTADTNKNWKIDGNELTRVISIKNAVGGYKAQAGTEDGFATITSVSAQPSVDLRINGLDSASVVNNNTAKISWTSTGVQSCTASGSMFSISGGSQWGNNGILSASGDATLIITTSANLPSRLSVGIQCRSANGNSVIDNVQVTITAAQTTAAVPPTVQAPTNIVPPAVVPPVTNANLTNNITFSSVPSSVTAGATFNVVVINAGTKPWGPWHNIALSSSDLSTNFQMLNLGTTVTNASKTVTFTAPTVPGTYKIRSLEHNVAWFGDVKTITVMGAQTQQTQPQVQPITGTLSVSSTCVVPGTNVVATATVTGDGITSKNLEKDTNADGVFGTAATWGSGVGTHSFTTAEGGAYSGRIDLKLVVNGSVRDSKSVTVSTACGPQTQNYSQLCAGTQPSGAGVVKGYESYTTGYGTNQWTFTTASAPSACQWTCASGYGLSGNSCQQNPTTPAPITYQSCSGTEPSGSYVTKGNGSYQTGYGTTNWTFVTGTPAACQFACANGATWNGAACTLPTPTVSLMADTSCAAPGSTITVTSYVSGSPIESNYIERDTPAENSQVGDGIFGGKADYGTSGGSHSYSQVTEREGYYDFRAVVNNSITSSVRVYSGASCGDTSMIEGSSNLGSAVVGFDSLVKLLQLLK